MNTTFSRFVPFQANRLMQACPRRCCVSRSDLLLLDLLAPVGHNLSIKKGFSVKKRERLHELGKIDISTLTRASYGAVRFVLFGFFVGSASLGALIATTQLIAALRGVSGALPVNEALQNLAIDLAAAGGFGYLLRQDFLAREKQIARLTREENLGALSIALANGKRVQLSELRSFARVVLVAGTPAQVQANVAAAEPLREALIERGVLVVPLPVFGDPQEAAAAWDGLQSSLTPADLRWKAAPLRLEKWRDWFAQQARLANVSEEKGLYVGLRIDGRVRASGTGTPPWAKFAAQLAPLSGAQHILHVVSKGVLREESSHPVAVQILSTAFAAGAVGGVANFLIAPVFGILHITLALGVNIAPPFAKADLYHKVFWGGLWGLVFMSPLRKAVKSWWVRATFWGLLPSLVQIFLVFPLSTPFGIGGVGLGALTPLFVLIFNTVGWSIPAYAWFKLAGYEDASSIRSGAETQLLLDDP